jgi:hypothetical protein
MHINLKIALPTGWRKALAVTSLLLAGAACQPAETHQLTATVTQEGATLAVKGKATLPDQALILVSLTDPTKSAQYSEDIIVQEFAQAKGGEFQAVLTPLKPVPAGKYRIRLRFSPDSYDPTKGAVAAAVGPKGEKLKGKAVVDANGVKMLQTYIPIDYQEAP